MAGPTPPEFTHTFSVPKDNYGNFIRLVQQDVIRYCDDRRPGIHQPVLPREEDVPRHWFHVVLRTATSSVTLAIRIDNLYLVGFTTSPPGSTTRTWWEFNNSDGIHFINGSKFLGFGGAYGDIVGHRKELDAVTLGRAEMTSAVDFLAENYGGGRAEQRQQGADSYAMPKSKLAKLVIMVCEGVRFHTVYGRVDKEFEHTAANMSKVEGKQVREWEKISRRVREWAANPTAKFPELEEIGIKDKNDAARIVAIIKDEKPRR
ncbi:hypothetical protein EJB05_47409, partial [Eragrostis curvula]